MRHAPFGRGTCRPWNAFPRLVIFFLRSYGARPVPGQLEHYHRHGMDPRDCARRFAPAPPEDDEGMFVFGQSLKAALGAATLEPERRSGDLLPFTTLEISGNTHALVILGRSTSEATRAVRGIHAVRSNCLGGPMPQTYAHCQLPSAITVDSRACFSTPSEPAISSSPVPPAGTPVATVACGEEPAPPVMSQRSSSPGEVPSKGSPPGTTARVRWASASGTVEERKCSEVVCGSGTGGNRNRRRGANVAPHIQT